MAQLDDFRLIREIVAAGHGHVSYRVTERGKAAAARA
jgi:hypothetical protein